MKNRSWYEVAGPKSSELAEKSVFPSGRARAGPSSSDLHWMKRRKAASKGTEHVEMRSGGKRTAGDVRTAIIGQKLEHPPDLRINEWSTSRRGRIHIHADSMRRHGAEVEQRATSRFSLEHRPACLRQCNDDVATRVPNRVGGRCKQSRCVGTSGRKRPRCHQAAASKGDRDRISDRSPTEKSASRDEEWFFGRVF